MGKERIILPSTKSKNPSAFVHTFSIFLPLRKRKYEIFAPENREIHYKV
jgi:hypothetical protein